MQINIQYLSGDTETRTLSTKQPLSIGRHGSCDIIVDEEGVGQMHCRVTWNGELFEVTAANLDGVELNGSLVRKAALRDGDVIRVGSIDLRASDSPDDTSSDEYIPLADDIELKPLDEDEKPPGWASVRSAKDEEEDAGVEIRLPEGVGSRQDEPPTSTRVPTPAARKRRRRRQSGDAEQPRRRKAKKKSSHPIEQIFDDDEVAGVDSLEVVDDEASEEPSTGTPMLSRGRSAEEDNIAAEAPPAAAPAQPLRERIRGRPKRPGEQETLKSPVVLILGGGSIGLTLLVLILYFMIGRSEINTEWERAKQAADDGRYSQAREFLTAFKEKYPTDEEYTPQAKLLLGKVNIEAEIGGSKSWKEGVEQVNAYRDLIDVVGFSETRGYMFETVLKIALGTAKDAGDSMTNTKNGRGLLELSSKANAKLNLYKPEDEGEFTDAVEQIRLAQVAAAAALRRQEHFDLAMEKITGFLEKKLPMEVLIARRQLLDEYRDIATDQRLSKILTRALADALSVEQGLIKAAEQPKKAVTEDRANEGPPSLSLTLHTQITEASENRVVFVTSRDCCFAVDTITGVPVWRRVIGLGHAFAPHPVRGAVTGLLLHDVANNELVFVERADGKLKWRQPLEKTETVAGPPLVVGGSVYLVTRSDRGHLSRFKLDDGTRTARLDVSQPVNAPPVLLAGGKEIVLAGHREVLYRLALAGLVCRRVVYLGHPAGSIQAPLVAMGKLVLMPQNGAGGNAGNAKANGDAAGDDSEKLVVAANDRLGSCLLRVLSVADDGSLPQIAERRIDGGLVVDRPALRGRSLFVPFAGERIAVYTVSDEPEHEPLTRVATHPVETTHSGRIDIEAGPGGHLWVAGGALRRYRLTTDALKEDSRRLAEGISWQPLRSIGQNLFAARQLLYSDAIVFSRIERNAEDMIERWKTEVGCALLEARVLGNGALLCLTQTGGLFHVRDADFGKPFKHQAEGNLPLPAGLEDRLGSTTFADGRVAVWCGKPASPGKPQLWIINTVGRLQQTIELDEPLEAPPVDLAGGIVVPLPGRLKLVGRPGGSPAISDFKAPVTKKIHRWLHTARLDDTHLVVVHAGGQLQRLQLGSATLQPVDTLEIDQPADVRLHSFGNRLAVVDGGTRLRMFNAADMQPIAEVTLEQPATGGPWSAGNRLLIETGEKQLLCLDPADQLKQLWSVDLAGHSLAGAPLARDGKLLVALEHGRVFVVGEADGKAGPDLQIVQPLSLGPRAYGSMILVGSIDGTLYRIEGLLNAQ